MRIAFALPGFHKVDRGAEVALLAVASALADAGDQVTVFGSGDQRPGTPYTFRHLSCVPRERFEKLPAFPPMRSEVMWEDATFAAAFMLKYRPRDFDAVVTCSFPFTQVALRRPTFGRKPLQIFVTQNGDWPAYANNAEYRFFSCDGLVCINPDYYERNRAKWNCALIPNGADLSKFAEGSSDRAKFGLPADRPIVLMVSALIDTKRVLDGIVAVGRHSTAHLVVAGDGPLRDEAAKLVAQHLPGRFTRLTLTAGDMPDLYRAADAFLHMSLFESFGNVFVEAMACGLPVVGHDTPRLRWIVGDQQVLCDTENPAALDAAISEALGKGRGAIPERVKDFAWDKIGAQYGAFLQRLIAARSGNPPAP
jgi:glycosyltransferase involved in cell wall biosynthesis